MDDFLSKLVARAAGPAARVLRLFGPLRLTQGTRRIELPDGTARLVAFVALHPGGASRTQLATALWPAAAGARADGNLRSALWRLRRARVDVLAVTGETAVLSDDLLVDVHLLECWARRAIAGRLTPPDLASGPLTPGLLDLLPGWPDDWVIAERERVRQRLLDGLEALSRHLAAIDRGSDAVHAAMVAVATDPLRESAQRTLIEVHLADGNWIEAHRSFQAYRRLLNRELGVEPGPAIAELLRQRRRTAV